MAECRHDAEALKGLRAELDGATVDGCLAELKEYEEKAIGVAKKYYDEGIDTVEALLGTWGSSGPHLTSENSKTPRGDAGGARPGGPPSRGRGRGRVGGSSFQPALPPGTPYTPSSLGGGAQGRNTEPQAEPQSPDEVNVQGTAHESLERPDSLGADPRPPGNERPAGLDGGPSVPQGQARGRAGVNRGQRRRNRRRRNWENAPGPPAPDQGAIEPGASGGSGSGGRGRGAPQGRGDARGRGGGWQRPSPVTSTGTSYLNRRTATSRQRSEEIMDQYATRSREPQTVYPEAWPYPNEEEFRAKFIK